MRQRRRRASGVTKSISTADYKRLQHLMGLCCACRCAPKNAAPSVVAQLCALCTVNAAVCTRGAAAAVALYQSWRRHAAAGQCFRSALVCCDNSNVFRSLTAAWHLLGHAHCAGKCEQCAQLASLASAHAQGVGRHPHVHAAAQPDPHRPHQNWWLSPPPPHTWTAGSAVQCRHAEERHLTAPRVTWPPARLQGGYRPETRVQVAGKAKADCR